MSETKKSWVKRAIDRLSWGFQQTKQYNRTIGVCIAVVFCCFVVIEPIIRGVKEAQLDVRSREIPLFKQFNEDIKVPIDHMIEGQDFITIPTSDEDIVEDFRRRSVVLDVIDTPYGVVVISFIKKDSFVIPHLYAAIPELKNGRIVVTPDEVPRETEEKNE